MLIKILIIENSVCDRTVLKNMLSEHIILTACDGIDAMRQVEENNDINLIILDLSMQKMDGMLFLNALKTNEHYKNIRTIILTSSDELDNEIKGLELGAIDYIRKPISMECLKARIEVHTELIRVQNLFEEKLYQQGLTFNAIFNQAPIGISISHSIDPFNVNNDTITSINPMFEQITGRSSEELIKLGWGKITHPSDLKEDIKNFKKLQAGKIKSYSMDKRYIRPDGSLVWVHMIVALLALSDDRQYNHICLVQDITERKLIEKALAESERSKSVLLSHLPGLAYRCSYNRDWTMQYVSDGCFDLTGYAPESLIDNKELSFNDIIAPEYHLSLWNEWEHILAKRLPFNYEYQIITKKGQRKWVLEMGQGIFNDKGEVEALEGIILDISDRKEIENNLRYKNEHDILTGLFNRNYLENLLKSDSERQQAEKRAIIGIDLKAIHSLTITYGFHYTQDLIKNISDALKMFCTDKRLLFRTYESRFVFYLKKYRDKKELLGFCEMVADTLAILLTDERIGGGIGVVEIDQENEKDVDQLLKKLLITSEKAFSVFENDFEISFYDMEMEAQTIREEDIKRELNRVATDEKDGGLFLQYQPILDLKTNKISGFEALARLNCDKLGRVPPLEFIPIAEKTKLIVPVGYKVIRQAFGFLNKLKEKGFNSVNVSINISVIQLIKNNFCENLFKIIDEMKVNLANISLEITESVFASNFDEINKILGVLKEFGLSIAIDDFGTGYSSLARERELNINCLKIDKHFINNLLFINPEKDITGDIISMAHKFDHYVIAEGVEEEKQKQYLLDFGCDKIQGYLIGKPLDEDMAIALLEEQANIKDESCSKEYSCL